MKRPASVESVPSSKQAVLSLATLAVLWLAVDVNSIQDQLGVPLAVLAVFNAAVSLWLVPRPADFARHALKTTALTLLLGAPLAKCHLRTVALGTLLAVRFTSLLTALPTVPRITSAPVIAAALTWVASILYALDWDVWWQAYPYPTVVAVEIGTLVGWMVERVVGQ
ncbi:hypothetical protein AMAG_20078 [Allomyces macrogynus ATCC 38327]|uniref:Uncharacterized protein n=1 Tax=Allomyces macrogynus (strain ATCC 38327) TaxID=578462 RepID=A0A0L0T6C2_ALLM3|nr:hypothetical protein AMAG_20078 [Allomyces macrogynus ATCC 38327]|eukprot:KNE70300.1 hypothetical protein AMAG_20078 [Allomyces macrogynus ATCC 38327]